MYFKGYLPQCLPHTDHGFPGDGYCDGARNIEECEYDGGDCCSGDDTRCSHCTSGDTCLCHETGTESCAIGNHISISYWLPLGSFSHFGGGGGGAGGGGRGRGRGWGGGQLSIKRSVLLLLKNFNDLASLTSLKHAFIFGTEMAYVVGRTMWHGVAMMAVIVVLGRM